MILLLTLRIIEDRIIVEVSEERLRRDLLLSELTDRRRRSWVEGIRNFAEVGDEVCREVVRVVHRVRVGRLVTDRRGQRRGHTRARYPRDVARGLRPRLCHRVLIRDRRIQVVSLKLVLGAHQVFHLLLVLGVEVLRGIRVHQAEPYSPAVLVAMFLYEVYLILGERRHGNRLYPVWWS